MSRTFFDAEGVLIIALAVLVLLLLVAGAFFLIDAPGTDPDGQTVTQPVDTTPQTQRPPPLVSDSTLEFIYPGQDGRTVLDLLEQRHAVTLDSELLLFGAIVIAIDSFPSGPDQFWIYYRDSAEGDRSPDVCTTYPGETIRWVLRRRK